MGGSEWLVQDMIKGLGVKEWRSRNSYGDSNQVVLKNWKSGES